MVTIKSSVNIVEVTALGSKLVDSNAFTEGN